MAWYFAVDFGSGLVDISAHCSAPTKTQRLHSYLRATVDTCAFTVHDVATVNAFLTSDAYGAVTITKDAAAWFKGYVRPTFSAQVSAGLDELAVECVDAGILLQKTVTDAIAYTGFKVCDTTTKAASILHQLFYASGIADADLSLTTINKTIANYAIDPADKATYWDAISELCFEFGYVFRVNNAGVFVLVDLFPTSYSPTVLDDEDVYHGVVVKKQERQYEAARVEWHPQATLTNQIVFEDTSGSDGTTPCAIAVAAGAYYPEGAGTGDVYCEYRLDGYDIIAASGAVLKLSANGVATQTFTGGYKRALLKLYSATGGKITTLRIKAAAVVVRDLCTIKRAVRYVVAGSDRVYEYAAAWIADATAAERLSNGVAGWFEYADFAYEFPTEIAMVPGTYYQFVEDAVLGITVDVRVVETTEDEYGGIAVVAEGMDEYTVTSAGADDSVASARPGVALAFELDDEADRAQDGWDSAPSASELFDLSQPDCVSSLGRRPSAKEITYEPGHLYDEVGTEYDNALVKFAGRGVIGCFGATTNLVQSPEDLTDATYWTPTSATAAASTYSWRGRPFTLVTASASTAGNVTQILAATSGQIHCFSVTVRKGSGATSQLLIRDSYAGTVRANVTITWATASAAAATGTLFRADFYASDTICEVVVIGTAIGSATPVVTLRPDTTAGTGTAYFTAVQVEDKDFPTPYTPTSRPEHSRIEYPMTPAGTGTIELWFRPWHTYDIADRDKYVFVLGGTGASIANTVSLRYDIATDKYIALIYQDASNYRSVASDSAFATNASLWAWRHLKVVWDIPNQTIQLFVDGVEQTAAASAGTVSSMAFNANALWVGGLGNSSGNDYVANSLITDFLYRPSVADTSADHYTNAVPWYDTSEVTNKYQSVRINRYGIRLHNANIGISDDYGRYIGISPAEGLLARDAAGTIIHDIPTAPILVGAYPMGHFYEFKYALDEYTLLASATYAAGWTTGLQAIRAGNGRIGGVRVKIWVKGAGSAYSVAHLGVALRPTGTTWSSSSGTTPHDMTEFALTSNLITTVERMVVMDCPVDDEAQFDCYTILQPSPTSGFINVKQLGVWI